MRGARETRRSLIRRKEIAGVLEANLTNLEAPGTSIARPALDEAVETWPEIRGSLMVSHNLVFSWSDVFGKLGVRCLTRDEAACPRPV